MSFQWSTLTFGGQIEHFPTYLDTSTPRPVLVTGPCMSIEDMPRQHVDGWAARFKIKAKIQIERLRGGKLHELSPENNPKKITRRDADAWCLASF